MELKQVIESLEKAKDAGYCGYIEVTIPNQSDTEFIVNKPESIDNKVEYYKNTYDENGIHKHCKDIHIVDSGTVKWDDSDNMNTFGGALEFVKKGYGMRLPSWGEDVVVRAQFPDEHSKMTAPYLYVESRYGKVPWKETMIELFSENWIIVE